MGRGLRGIAFVGGEIYIAASDELFVFDRSFNIVRSHGCPFLHHCHEISYDGERYIYVTSTSFNSILRFDARRVFRCGVVARDRAAADPGACRGVDGGRAVRPDGGGGAAQAGHVLHINQVFWWEGAAYVSGLRADALWRLDGDRIGPAARVPMGTHNCRPLDSERLVMNDDEGRLRDDRGSSRAGVGEDEVPALRRVRDGEHRPWRGLRAAGVRARAVRGRGGRDGVAGSSPGTVSAFDRGRASWCGA